MFSSFKRATAAWFLTASFVAVANAQTDHADTSATTTSSTAPFAVMQFASLTGSASTITASWIPVVTSTGTIYKNIVIEFQIDSSGNLTLASGYPQITTVTPPIATAFESGKYIGPSDIDSGNALITIAGPSSTAGGATEWSLAAAPTANSCTYPNTATWYVGAITLNPIWPRLKAAGISSTAWSYGVGNNEPCGSSFYAYNALLGFSQVGNTITIVSFTDSGGNDHNVPQQEITYTLTQ